MSHQNKYLKLTISLSFLTIASFSNYSLANYLNPQIAQAQTTETKKTDQKPEATSSDADRLFQEAEKLIGDNNQFVNAFIKYKEALKIYRHIGDTANENKTRQKLESVLATSLFLAQQQEEIIHQDEAKFLNQFPKSNNNQTANKLQELAAAKLGFALFGGTKSFHFPVSKTALKEFKDIEKELQDYLDNQTKISTNKVEKIPQKLRQYLERNAETLKSIRTLILTNEPLHWATDISWIVQGDLTYSLPSYISFEYLQKVLALDILNKQEQGNTKEMLESLETSWKINESLRNSPLLIGQVLHIITTRIQLGTIRQLNNLPSQWQKRLVTYDHRQSILQSLIGNAIEFRAVFKVFSEIKEYSDFKKSIRAVIGDIDKEDDLLTLGISEWSNSMRQNFIRWQAIVNYQNLIKVYSFLVKEDVCSFQFDSFWSKIKPTDKNLESNYISQWLKAGRLMLELELTQKILQAKENLANLGSFKQISSVKSTVCPNNQWVYQVSPDNNSISISLNPIPKWISDVKVLPLTYTIVGKNRTQN